MKIKSIKYPEGCELAGWNKMVFERRMRKALGDSFSVCDLDRCRAEILGQGRDNERRDELSVFHCESIKSLPIAELKALVDKTAQYVGVEIVMGHTSRVPGVVVAAVVGIAIGAASAWLIPAANNAKTVTRTNHAEQLASEIQLPILPVPSAVEASPEPVFSTTVRTNRPAATARTLASTVQNVAGEYDVSLTVTPTSERQVSARLDALPVATATDNYTGPHHANKKNGR